MQAAPMEGDEMECEIGVSVSLVGLLPICCRKYEKCRKYVFNRENIANKYLLNLITLGSVNLHSIFPLKC